MPQKLILVRGIPGSGKSTFARRLKGFTHYEADMFFEVDGKYVYNREYIVDAHEWCQANVYKALFDGKNVVVSNTFIRKAEMEPYFDMAKRFGITAEIVEAKGEYGSIHDIPDYVIERMKARWEPVET